MRPTVSARRSGFISTTTTSPPSPANRSAEARPIPCPAPVTTTTLPSNRIAIISPPPARPRDDVGGDVAGQPRVLLESPDRVRMPVLAVRDVDPNAVPRSTSASPRSPGRRGASGTRTRRRRARGGRSHRAPASGSTRRARRPRRRRRREQLVEQPDVAAADRRRGPNRQRSRGSIQIPLTSLNPRRERQQRAHVVARAPQVGLEREHDVVVAILAEPAVDVDRRVGRGRVLHVELDRERRDRGRRRRSRGRSRRRAPGRASGRAPSS